jgi:hypothetical protein
MSGTQRRMTADERERLTRLRVEQASHELAQALIVYGDWLIARTGAGTVMVRETLEQALRNYALAVGS